MRIKAVAAICSFALSGTTLCQNAPASSVLSAWVQTVGARSEIRAIIEPAAACPVARVNGKPLVLVRRGELSANSGYFPPLCQAELPASAKLIMLLGRKFEAPRRDVRRIVVIGDTGCRQNATEKQDCEREWPFRQIADNASRKHPDLIIHVGDYYYREICPAYLRRCENWNSWNADFFQPANRLLASAPWVFARGNHETCDRAAEGWFRYLDAADEQLPCPKAKATTFLVKLSKLTLAVLDTADMPDIWPADQKLKIFVTDLGVLKPPKGVSQWIVTHKPPFVDGFMNGAPKHAEEDDPLIPDLDLILAGHLHLFASMNFTEGRPAQLIVGDSGTRLMVAATKLESKTLEVGSRRIDAKDAGFTFKGQFGYFLLQRDKASSTLWKGTLYAVDDTVIATCDLRGKQVSCKPARPH